MSPTSPTSQTSTASLLSHSRNEWSATQVSVDQRVNIGMLVELMEFHAFVEPSVKIIANWKVFRTL
ncbi:hypothetical protein NG798_24455 [Ancylothrix sp. C2]|uniref:hypothetical protein n=1 Tax=Ancylothrix sp. D3o TaxID=2953691 RepID=UPI0021BACDA8|nr:hypothetical protein [Ancylothrix sp. D3o]MCT7952954.1 hypothetical protein [Ancylothrix sp. D3o]